MWQIAMGSCSKPLSLLCVCLLLILECDLYLAHRTARMIPMGRILWSLQKYGREVFCLVYEALMLFLVTYIIFVPVSNMLSVGIAYLLWPALAEVTICFFVGFF